MSEPRLGLALGGGGARGLAHIHVLHALEDLGLRARYLTGTSIGAVMGAGCASGMSASDIEEYVLSTFTDPTEVLGRFWQMRPVSLREVWNGPRTMLGNIDAHKAVSAFMPPSVPMTFEELEIPLKVVATDFYGQQEVVLGTGDLLQAVAASAALPAVFEPVQRDGVALVDGGIVNAVPYELLIDQSDIVVAVDVVGGPKKSKGAVPTRIEALTGASQLMMQATTRLKRKIAPPDVWIQPEVNGIGVLDFLKASKILDATRPTRDLAKRKIEAAMSHI